MLPMTKEISVENKPSMLHFWKNLKCANWDIILLTYLPKWGFILYYEARVVEKHYVSF